MTQNIIDTNGRPGWRHYELDIIVGELYEVWLHHDWAEPKTCVPVDRAFTFLGDPDWKILVDGQVKEVHAGQIFRIGTATEPEDPFTLPFVKRVYSGFVPNQIVKVQPMTMPTSSIFYMDYKFGKEEE